MLIKHVDVEFVNSILGILTFVVALFIIRFIVIKKYIFKARLFLEEEKLVELFFLFVISIGVFSGREILSIFYGHTVVVELLETLSMLIALISMASGYFLISHKGVRLK